MILVSGVIGWIGVPEVRYRSVASWEARRPRASSAERESAQVISEVSGSRWSSRATSACIAVLTDTAMTGASPTAATHSARASTTAVLIARGSCTCQPGCGADSGYSRSAV